VSCFFKEARAQRYETRRGRHRSRWRSPLGAQRQSPFSFGMLGGNPRSSSAASLAASPARGGRVRRASEVVVRMSPLNAAPRVSAGSRHDRIDPVVAGTTP
jgi:hypothetical protein